MTCRTIILQELERSTSPPICSLRSIRVRKGVALGTTSALRVTRVIGPPGSELFSVSVCPVIGAIPKLRDASGTIGARLAAPPVAEQAQSSLTQHGHQIHPTSCVGETERDIHRRI